MPIVQIQSISKRYILRHQTDRQGAYYTTLRDTIARKMRTVFKPNGNVGNVAREEFWALRDVSLNIEQGDVVGLIGRNGAGKSTLLKVLSRITEPTCGRVRIKGRLASLLEVGTGFHPELTGRENVYLNGAILGMSKVEIQRKFDEIVAFSEIEKFLDTPVKRYSSGMYVRLAFAVAAHLEPDILVVDEVLAVGDALFQKKCLGKIQDVATNQGRTVFFVSHNLGAVASLCTRGVVMERGKIVADEKIQDALAIYSRQVSKAEVTFNTKTDSPSIQGVEVDEQSLRNAQLRLKVYFTSPFPLNPIVSAVISNQRGAPLLSSNMLHNTEGYVSRPMCKGSATLSFDELPLHSGSYRVSVWLGDKVQNYDAKRDVLSFEHLSKRQISGKFNADEMGSLNLPSTWTLEEEPVSATKAE